MVSPRTDGGEWPCMSKASVRKGKSFEREVSEALRAVFPESRRGLSQSRGGGAEEADVIGVAPFHIECKADEQISAWAALRQATADAADNEVPVAVMKRNRKGTIAVVDFEVFLTLARKYMEGT